MKLTSIATATLKTHRLRRLMAPGNLSNPANPSSLQITSQLVARGAGGRGEALIYPPPCLRAREWQSHCSEKVSETDFSKGVPKSRN